MKSKNALILVDVQNDFLPGGALPVADGDRVVPIANELMSRFELIVATQDWHPANHASFAANHPGKQVGDNVDLNGLPQILWPTHCVQDTRGAEFAPGLEIENLTRIFRKGTDPAIDSYSGFFDNGHRRSTGLADYLKAQNAHDLYIMGLATDYCVKFTALDARQQNFNVHLILDACRGVKLHPGDIAKAIEEMKSAGVHLVNSDNV